jgi:hypothetical protein
MFQDGIVLSRVSQAPRHCVALLQDAWKNTTTEFCRAVESQETLGRIQLISP